MDEARHRGPLVLDPGLAHEWRVTLDDASMIQRRLEPHVVLRPLPAGSEVASAAGVDVAYSKDGSRAWAAAVLMDRSFRTLAEVVVEGEPDLPYVRGYLAFREGQLSVAALLALPSRPDLVFFDGHGVVHERGLGLASHVGVLLDVPAIGVPKTPFHAVERTPARERGSYDVLTKEWGAQGAAVRLKAGSKPVYVSPGHLVDLPSAIALAPSRQPRHRASKRRQDAAVRP